MSKKKELTHAELVDRQLKADLNVNEVHFIAGGRKEASAKKTEPNPSLDELRSHPIWVETKWKDELLDNLPAPLLRIFAVRNADVVIRQIGMEKDSTNADFFDALEVARQDALGQGTSKKMEESFESLLASYKDEEFFQFEAKSRGDISQIDHTAPAKRAIIAALIPDAKTAATHTAHERSKAHQLYMGGADKMQMFAMEHLKGIREDLQVEGLRALLLIWMTKGGKAAMAMEGKGVSPHGNKYPKVQQLYRDVAKDGGRIGDKLNDLANTSKADVPSEKVLPLLQEGMMQSFLAASVLDLTDNERAERKRRHFQKVSELFELTSKKKAVSVKQLQDIASGFQDA